MARDDPTVSHHDDAVRDLRDLIEPMADVDERHAFGFEISDLGEQKFGLFPAQGCGRLVQDEQPGVKSESFGDLDLLLCSHP